MGTDIADSLDTLSVFGGIFCYGWFLLGALWFLGMPVNAYSVLPTSVKIMREKMDPEELGIITLNGFMDEFFPSEAQSEAVQSFTVFHYNGLPSSGPGHKVGASSGHRCLCGRLVC